MNKLVFFELDGVLIDSRDMHYEALNCVLENVDKKCVISKDDYIRLYDGITTSRKLAMLTEKRVFPIDTHQHIWEDKQKATFEIFSG